MTAAVFQVRSGSGTGRRLRMAHWPTVVGRAENCGLRLRDQQVSRLHCELLAEASGLVVRDLRSRNGTFVNGQRIHQATTLQTGDQLRIGQLVLEFVALSAGEVPPESPSSDSVPQDTNRMTLDELVQFDRDESLLVPNPLDALDSAGSEEPAEAPQVPGNFGTTTIGGETLAGQQQTEPREQPQPGSQRSSDSVESTRDAARQALRKLFHGRS